MKVRGLKVVIFMMMVIITAVNMSVMMIVPVTAVQQEGTGNVNHKADPGD